MEGRIFEVDTYGDLPLWAQVLMASRLVRRAALWLPDDVPEETRQTLLAACDAMDRCAIAGEWLKAERAVVEQAANMDPVADACGAVSAMYYAADATHAAHDSLDFSAAESACTSSAGKAMAEAGKSTGLNPLQVRIFAAADVDLLRFACKEAGVGRYDGLGNGVMERLCPVYPPDERDRTSRERSRPDPTGGAR